MKFKNGLIVKNLKLVFSVGLMFLLVSFASIFAGTPEEILEKAEFIRNPPEEYSCLVTITDKKKDVVETPKEFKAQIKGRDKALVTYLKPLPDKDTRVLMVERDMWVMPNNSKKSIRVAANQKLSGNAAYGDITRLSFVGNYKAKLIDAPKEVRNYKDTYVLELESIPGAIVTYDRIEYWIDKKTFRPLRIFYRTLAGKLIREASFDQYEEVFGVSRPTRMILLNSLSKGHETILTFSKTKVEKFKDSVFVRAG